MQSSTSALGIDEAGRGAHVGPLVLAAVAVTSEGFSELQCLALRDSKFLSDRRRRKAAEHIRRIAVWIGIEVRSSSIVDRFVGRGRATPRLTLNVLEQRMALRLIKRAPSCDQVVADGRLLFSPLMAKVSCLRAEDHADEDNPVVAAAAILAKCERDRLVERIDQECASLCGRLPRRGYPGPETSAWIERYCRFFGSPPPHVRASWYRTSPS